MQFSFFLKSTTMNHKIMREKKLCWSADGVKHIYVLWLLPFRSGLYLDYRNILSFPFQGYLCSHCRGEPVLQLTLSVEFRKNLSQRQKLVSNYKEIRCIIFSIFLLRGTVFSCDIPLKLCELRWARTFLCIKLNNSLAEQINLWSTSKAVY